MSTNKFSVIMFVCSSLVSAFVMYQWIFRVEYIQARGAVVALLVSQTILVSLGVYLVRRKRLAVRVVALLLFGQLASMASDWVWAFLVDSERAGIAINSLWSNPGHPGAILVLLSSWVLLGGVQALMTDATWRIPLRLLSVGRR